MWENTSTILLIIILGFRLQLIKSKTCTCAWNSFHFFILHFFILHFFSSKVLTWQKKWGRASCVFIRRRGGEGLDRHVVRCWWLNMSARADRCREVSWWDKRRFSCTWRALPNEAAFPFLTMHGSAIACPRGEATAVRDNWTDMRISRQFATIRF